jgi:hypothetical protein
VEVQCHFIMILICISLMISDAERIFMCLPVICLSSEKCLFRLFPCFFKFIF